MRSKTVFGMVTNILRYCIHDGPGIRTTVFLKGCSLRCRWCSNPECLNPFPELGFLEKRCIKCQDCLRGCPKGAISNEPEGYPFVDRGRCDNCGKCTSVCYPGALLIFGHKMTAAGVFDEVIKDSLFYRRSGGGVTISGGDPLRQPDFLVPLLQLCQSNRISTAMETCGYANPKLFQDILKYVDYLLFDVKHLEAAVHRRYTGRSNRLVIKNLKVAVTSGVNLLVRMPLVPGINDTECNIKATAELLRAFGKKIEGIELMPYHRLGLTKYKALGRSYPMGELPSADVNWVENVRAQFESFGVCYRISR